MLQFVSIFFLFNYIPSTISLHCLGRENSNPGTPTSCKFSVNFNDDLPSLDDLKSLTHPCKMIEAEANPQNDDNDGTCYGEVRLNSTSKTLSFQFQEVKHGFSTKKPFDRMMGATTGKQQVLQIQVKGSVDDERLDILLRFQCKTSDNCAWEKLRGIFPDSTAAAVRITVYQEMKKNLFNENKTTTSPLQCYKDHQQMQTMTCWKKQNRCKFFMNATQVSVRHCSTKRSNSQNDFDLHLTSEEDQWQAIAAAPPIFFEYMYFCSFDLCNTGERYTEMLHFLAHLLEPPASAFNPSVTLAAPQSPNPMAPGPPPPPAHQNQVAHPSVLNKPGSNAAKYFISPMASIPIIYCILLKIFS